MAAGFTVGQALDALFTAEGRADPFSRYARLAAAGPVLDLGRTTLVLGYEQCAAALRDPGLRVRDADWADRETPGWTAHDSIRTILGSVLSVDGTRHAGLRAILAKPFRPRQLGALRPVVEAEARRLAEQLSAGGERVDLAADFAGPLPVAVLAGLLGVGVELAPFWLGRRLDVMSPANDHLASGADLAAADRAAREVGDFAAALLADPPRGAPLAPMLAELAAAPYPGEVRTANLVMLLAAGTETARSMLAHALHVLLHDPALADALRAEPGLVPGFVAETLRTRPPAHVTSRWTSCPVDLAGTGVPADRLVLVLLAAANRDPGRFPDPGGFSVRRGDDGLAFGLGRHYCLGAGLARELGRIGITEILRRFSRLDADGPSVRADQLVIRGFARLPARLTP